MLKHVINYKIVNGLHTTFPVATYIVICRCRLVNISEIIYGIYGTENQKWMTLCHFGSDESQNLICSSDNSAS